MAADSDEAQTGVRVADGRGRASASTGLPVLDHLLGLLTATAGFDLTLEVAPGAPDDEVAAAGNALGRALLLYFCGGASAGPTEGPSVGVVPVG